MYPHERSLVKRLEKNSFVLLGINSDPKNKILDAITREKIIWPFFWDGGNTNGPIANAWKIDGWPTTYLIDAKGGIRRKNLRGKELEQAIDGLLKEMGETLPPPSTQPLDDSE